MDLASEELQFLSIPDILRESISIPKRSLKTLHLITLALIFPLSFAILAHSLFTHPILAQVESHALADPTQTRHEWALLLTFQFIYLIFLFAFSLLLIVAVVFTVSSLYTSNPVSFSSTIAAIPKVFNCLFKTFTWVSILMLVYNALLIGFLVIFVITVDSQNAVLSFLAFIVIMVLF